MLTKIDENSPSVELTRNENSPSQLIHNSPYSKASILLSLLYVFILTISPLIYFPDATKSAIWHCRRFWGASGDLWQAQWDIFLDTVGEDAFNIWTYGTIILFVSVYWLLGGIYMIPHIINKNSPLERYKIQPGTNQSVDSKKLMKVIFSVVVNQVVVSFPVTMLMYYILQLRGLVPLRELPAFSSVLYECTVFILVEEASLYYSHRLLHNKHVYKYIHKQHHEWTAPYAVVAIHCHPLEHIIANLIPSCLGVCIMNPHIVTAWLWFIMVIFFTLNAHCGYHLPFLPSPEAHDFHHLKLDNCFGVLGVLDRLHGTDKKFRSSEAYTRHIVILNTTPLRKSSPEPKACKPKLDKH